MSNKDLEKLLEGIDLGAAFHKLAWMCAKDKFCPHLMTEHLLKVIKDNALGDKKNDIDYMIMLYCERGNNLDAMRKSLPNEDLAKLKKLISVYNLKSSAGSDGRTLTLFRVTLCFPLDTCEYMKHKCINPTVAYSTLEAIVDNYPKVMMTGAFASCIPEMVDSTVTESIKKAHLLHEYFFSQEISKKSGEPVKLTDLNRRCSAGMSRSSLRNEEKIECCYKWGIITSLSATAGATRVVLKAEAAYDKLPSIE